MCTITETSHVHLVVPVADRREIARILLGAVELADACPHDPCALTATSDGFRVSRAVFNASGLLDAPPPAPEPVPEPVPVPAPPAPRTRKRRN